ncbi:FkbM family methyltransferase [Sphingomonas sp. PB4P5]|uniref:FkbM family methyltransferase n=1 Tax=Parasphingomonas puruogangriensis TaxID=3096155 RepID=UPI002FC90AB3
MIAETSFGKSGHAVYGPYEYVAPGDYKVFANVIPIDLGGCEDHDIVACLDVSLNYAKSIAAELYITAGELRTGKSLFCLPFSLSDKALTEYRVGVFGNARLRIDGYCPRGKSSDDDSRILFPRIDGNAPEIARHHPDRFRELFEQGFHVSVSGDDVVLTKDDISFYARCADDMNLVGEIFLEQVYRFEKSAATVVIDVGMNIGLVAMQFSKNPCVERVYSFDPFQSTFDRALANLSLNADLARKVVATRAGVSDRNGKLALNVVDTDDSGSRSTVEVHEGGIVVELDLEKASDVVRRVRAAHPDCDIVMKVDCEGAEFGIFENLAAEGLLGEVSTFMVEWHNAFPGKNQADLIAPLKAAGFTVIDRSPKTGNGFFYAVR